MTVRQLDRDQCLDIIEKNRLGRLACISIGVPYIVPIHYVHAEDHLYAFSMPGRKIEALRSDPGAAILVEDIDTPQHWRTVMVRGRYEELPDRIGFKRLRDRAWQLLSRHAVWWEPGAYKPVAPALAFKSEQVFFRISIDEISGRESIDGD
ncbi:pyridoxamine 5'-phosphate oxidase family protein [Aliihoeflea sp. 40Bstr573]|uniref:pyridoxamine 5'-phosphate oxidase family protein n=1 Tax=Aliihoeflea sp. 40Bstr573 TaxID=2696467 RepID=UPI002095F863|nr:pyridoxamine 5'-phosphate oxidase family protein [Aliihoeflea sp. 40Bstr573]MCO6388868.1 pyridoxamine 5'-phosphate oxidase family protein [Aliihoeflea sp. 40Bstr573]